MLRQIILTSLLLCTTPAAFAAVPKVSVSDLRSDGLNIELDKGQLVRLNGTAKSVFVANPDVADIQMLSPDSLMVFGKKTGETTLVATGNDDHTLLNQRVTVTQNLDGLKQALKAMVPNGTISAQAVPNGIVLAGNVANAGEAEDARRVAARYVPEGGEIINRIAVNGPSQVMLRVRFAEMTRSVNKAFGFDLNAFSAGNFAFGVATGSGFVNPTTGVITRPNNNDAIYAGFHKGSLDINGLIDALETEGLTTILAEPSLTATNGETASFLAGGEIPIPVPQSGSDNTITIDYKSYGVSLAFTPTILDGKHMSMRVKPEVSQLSQANAVTLQGFSIPSITTRRAETTVDISSGQSFVIAGLLQNNTDQTTNKLPGLGDLPVLGALFRSENFIRNESELVIIVTPYIVQPVNGQLASATDGFAVPAEGDRIMLDKKLSNVPVTPTAKLAHEPVSFTVE